MGRVLKIVGVVVVFLVFAISLVFFTIFRWYNQLEFKNNLSVNGISLNRLAVDGMVRELDLWKTGIYLWDQELPTGVPTRFVPRSLVVELTDEFQMFYQLRRFFEGKGAVVDLGSGQVWDGEKKKLTLKIYVSQEFLDLIGKDPVKLKPVLDRYIARSFVLMTETNGLPVAGIRDSLLPFERRANELLLKYKNIIEVGDKCGTDLTCRFYTNLGKFFGYLKASLSFVFISPVYAQTCNGFIECGIPWTQQTCSDGSGYCYSFGCNEPCNPSNPSAICQCENICDYGEFTDIVCDFRTTQSQCSAASCQPGACTNPFYQSSCSWSATPTPTPTPPATCPNGFCGSGESCSNCSQDCGACPTPTPPPGCSGNWWQCSGSNCMSAPDGVGECGQCPASCVGVLRGKRGFIVFNDTNGNGTWDYATEKRISSGNSTTCPGTNVEYVSGFGITFDGGGYSIDANCNTGTGENGSSADVICDGSEGCNDGDGNGTATTCDGLWGQSGAIQLTCIDEETCGQGCHWTGDYCKSGLTLKGALCGVRGGAYCTGSGTNGTLRDGPLLIVQKQAGSYPASVTIPSGWQASAGSPQSKTVNVIGDSLKSCNSDASDPNGGLIAFGVVRSPLPNPTGLTETCSADATQVTFRWNNVAGAVDYFVRVYKDSVLDQSFNASSACTSSGGTTSCIVNITPGANYTDWTVQPIATGESFPYITPPTSGGPFICAAPGTLTGTFFDASELASCPADPQTLSPSLKIGGGTLTMTGGPGYSQSTDGGGLYTITGIQTPNTYSLGAVPTADFVTTPKFACQGSTATYTATGGTLTRDFGFWKTYGGWFQALGGGVYGGTGITSNIPGSMPAGDRYLIDADADSQDGLAYYKSGSISLGTYPGLTVSSTGWNANSGYSGDKQDYAYWSAKMGIYTKTNWVGTGKPAYNPGTNGYEIYSYSGTATMNFSPSANEKVIYLINGDVNVTGNISVPKTAGSPSFLAVIASGTITFANNVTSAQGLWVGNSINIASTGNTATEVQFNGEGSFVGWSSITLTRDRGTTNNTAPAEKFTFRPDLIINAPAPMKLADTVFRLETP